MGGFDVHREQITFDYLDTVTGEVACTGWRSVIEELQRVGVAPHLAEPADSAAARGRRRRAKTDRADARLIRTLLAEDRLPECCIPPAQVLEYRALLELFQALRREHAAWVQRIHAVLFRQGVEHRTRGRWSTAANN